jgi:hypothetical protein
MVKLTAFRITLLCAAALLVVNCAGITAYDPPAYDEAPPGRGLFTGAEGEFVIYQKAVEADPDGEANKNEGQTQP